ncbi:9300_t:CDS:2 [Funneliformis mosseae]|uniref:9300_t:CDS:1 n=1 Tax=Funneliformis mosseae TaxID=27381 RepID=A0A9N9CV43_FUNMO|nr:9300_t:CDS:2 [Funneliformis mosseae]
MEHVEVFTFSHVEDLLRTTNAYPAKMNVFSTKSSNFSETMCGNRVGAGNSISKTFSKKEIVEMCRKMIMSTEFAMPICRLWHKKDDTFWVPKENLYCSF